MFQFLIGTVKTYLSSIFFLYAMLVSIPHRYCKNAVIINYSCYSLLVSIPHRYCKNVQKKGYGHYGCFLFQFLIGTVKTRLLTKIITGLLKVSIPHRYCKNGYPMIIEQSDARVSIPHRYCKNVL